MRRMLVAGHAVVVLALATVALGRAAASPNGVDPHGRGSDPRSSDAPSREAATASSPYEPGLVHAFAFTFDVGDWDSALRAAGDTGNARAGMVADGIALDDVGVRYKGLSSMLVWSTKRPLNVTTDAFVAGQRLSGYDVVNLNNGYSDPSFVRESLTTEMLRPFMPTQQTAYARVAMNGDYLGLYLAVEQVEGTFVSHWYPESDGILIKADPPAGPGMGATTFHSALEWEGEDLAAYRPLYEVKTTGEEETGLAIVRDAARVLDAPVSAGGVDDDAFPAAVSQVLDVDQALWYLAATNLFVNYDSYYFGHNYFLYHSEDDGLLHLLLWDTSLSFGGLDLGPWGGDGAGAHVDPYAMDDADERPVLRRLLAVPDWRADYTAHYRTLLGSAFDPDTLEQRGADLQSLIRPALVDDPNRLFSLDQFDRNLRDDVTARANMGPGGRSPGVVKLARDRARWLATLPALARPDHWLVEHRRAPDAPGAGQPVTVTVRFGGRDEPTAVRLVFRVGDGAPQSVELVRRDEAWEGVLPAQAPSTRVRYYARAALPGGRSAFHPEANLTQSWEYVVAAPNLPVVAGSPLVINELQADNITTLADEAGEYDDWLEVTNRGSTAIDLGAYFLGPDSEEPWRYRLPNVLLPPGGHYLVWCDRDPEQGVGHADFKLSRDGDEVRLSTGEETVDVVAFGALEADASWARLPDGAESWRTCDSPTPGEGNRCGIGPTPAATAVRTPTDAVTPVGTAGATSTATATSPPGPPPAGRTAYLAVLASRAVARR